MDALAQAMTQVVACGGNEKSHFFVPESISGQVAGYG